MTFHHHNLLTFITIFILHHIAHVSSQPKQVADLISKVKVW